MSEKVGRLIAALIFAAFGLTALFSYQTVLSLILNVALLISFLNGISRFWMGIRKKDPMELLIGLISLLFGAALLFYTFVPEWLLRVIFGWYCAGVGTSILIQQAIYLYNETRAPMSGWIFSCGYCVLGFLLLFSPSVSTKLLIQSFGIYFLLLSFRYLVDAIDTNNSRYRWRRFIHVSVPTALAPFLPDYYMSKLERQFKEKEQVALDLSKNGEKPLLRAMVHVGPEGLQKVGHFSFAWKDIVYSYGNYDVNSTKFGGLLGDGVFFTVPIEKYLPNLMKYERNTIFEYGIHVTKEQEEQIERALSQLKNNSYRWYTALERAWSIDAATCEDAVRLKDEYELDYPCRLHYRTGAKFFKIKKGRFHTYWATGENCVLFADQILGVIGADVLSVRGIVSPGAYFDYLQNEYDKENSPVISRIIHTAAAKGNA